MITKERLQQQKKLKNREHFEKKRFSFPIKMFYIAGRVTNQPRS